MCVSVKRAMMMATAPIAKTVADAKDVDDPFQGR
jgi:hypothetical protein